MKSAILKYNPVIPTDIEFHIYSNHMVPIIKETANALEYKISNNVNIASFGRLWKTRFIRMLIVRKLSCNLMKQFNHSCKRLESLSSKEYPSCEKTRKTAKIEFSNLTLTFSNLGDLQFDLDIQQPWWPWYPNLTNTQKRCICTYYFQYKVAISSDL